MATVNLTPEEEAAAAALQGDGTVSEVAAGPAGAMRPTRIDPAVAERELSRLARLEKAGSAPDPSAEEKLKEDWRPPRKKKDPPSEMQDHKVGVADSHVMVLDAWGTLAKSGRVVIQLTDSEGAVYTFETSPAFGRDLSNRILASSAKAQAQLQGIGPETNGEAG
jgi:hypothetical protein